MTKLVPLCLLLFVSCLKEKEASVRLSDNLAKYSIAVEGGVVAGKPLQYIFLSRPVTNGQLPSPASGAHVSIFDGTNQNELVETGQPGTYAGRVASQQYGVEYRLSIDFEGHHFEASDVLNKVTPVSEDFLPFSLKRQGNMVQLLLPRHTFGFIASGKWMVTYKGIPAYDNSEKNNPFFTYTHLEGTPNSLYPLESDNRTANLLGTDSITVNKFSLSKAYERYLYTVFQETDWKSIFSGTPSPVSGNIVGPGVGFFYAVDLDRHTFRSSR